MKAQITHFGDCVFEPVISGDLNITNTLPNLLRRKTISINYDIKFIKGGFMCNNKMLARVLYAVGIVGGVESFSGAESNLLIAAVALIVIIIASYLLEKE